jgi:Zn-dependent M28 family amino/carboxypeptidase
MAYVSLPSPSFADTITGLSAGYLDLDVVPLPSFPMLGNSDHYFFALAGVPSVFFFTGGQADTHQPGDTADKINAKKMAEVIKLAFLTAYSVADAPDRPRWE